MNNNNTLVIISIDEYSQIKKLGRIRIFDKRINKRFKDLDAIDETSFFQLIYMCPDVGLRAESYVLVELKKIDRDKIDKKAFIDIQNIENVYAFNNYAGQLLSLPSTNKLEDLWTRYLKQKSIEDSKYKGELFLKLLGFNKINSYRKKNHLDKLSFYENIILPNPELNGLTPEESIKFENCKSTYSYGWKAALTILRRLAIEYIKNEQTKNEVSQLQSGCESEYNLVEKSANNNQNSDNLQQDKMVSQTNKKETQLANQKVDIKLYWKIKDVRSELENIRKTKFSGPIIDDFYSNEIRNLDTSLKANILGFPDIPVAYLAIINHYGHFATIGKNFELSDFKKDLKELDRKFQIFAVYLVGQCMPGKIIVELLLKKMKNNEKAPTRNSKRTDETAINNNVADKQLSLPFD